MIEYDIIQKGNTAKIKLRNYVVKNYCKLKRKRGKITEFSNKSRRRMITRILQSKEFGFWIDLTLADDCEEKDIIVYKDEIVLIKRMLRRYYKNNKRIKVLSFSG